MQKFVFGIFQLIQLCERVFAEYELRTLRSYDSQVSKLSSCSGFRNGFLCTHHQMENGVRERVDFRSMYWLALCIAYGAFGCSIY